MRNVVIMLAMCGGSACGWWAGLWLCSYLPVIFLFSFAGSVLGVVAGWKLARRFDF